MSTHKVIGFFAYKTKLELVCEGQSLIITGSKEKMEEYLKSHGFEKTSSFTIKKTKFGEILEGLKRGAEYSFDSESYSRFYPLGLGENLELIKFEESNEEGKGFLNIKIN